MLPYNAINFLALPYLIGQSLLYPLVFVATPGKPIFAKIRAKLFAFLCPCLSVITRSRVQFSDLAPLYRTTGAALATGCHAVPRRPSVRRDSLPSNTGRRGFWAAIQYRPPRLRRVGRYWMAAQPFTWVTWVKTSVCFPYRIYLF